MTLTWNLVSKHIRPHEQLQSKVRQKIVKLERYLQPFPPEAVHLLVNLERHPRQDDFTASLTLRLPANILHVEKAAKGDPIPAFDKAMRALLRELANLKSELGREAAWHQRGPAKDATVRGTARFAPAPHPAGPRSLSDTLAEMIRRYHGRLLYHVQRQLHRDQADGEIPRGAIRAEVVVDEAVRQALSRPQKKPEELSYRMWLYLLVRRELTRRYRRLRIDGEQNVPLEAAATLPDDAELLQGYDAEHPLDIIEAKLEPACVACGDLLPDTQCPAPDAVAAEHDLIDYLHRLTAGWPEKERAVFDLHFLEGFDAGEIALLEDLKPAEAAGLIQDVQLRLREILVGAAGHWVRSRTLAAAGRPPAT